ncbi:MAG: helicase-exonuclease AddAB subunit AddB [Lachnospiraceae bacterium]|nr:helicase-exonuclease AddAB subunit AddB [Lachnospiraceae bacterium]
MGLNIIAGPSGYGKTFFCLNEISKKQDEKSSGKIVYIVPEQYSLQAEKDLIRATEHKGLMKAMVLSFSRLAFNILAETGGGRRPFLGETGKNMTLRKILSDKCEDLSYYKNSADKPGFILELSKTITELCQYNITPEDISNALESVPFSAFSSKLSDIFVIYEAYKKYLKENYISSDEALDIAYNKIPSAMLIKNSEFFIDGFNGFTPKELKIISMLLKYSKNVSVTLTISKESFEAAVKTNIYDLNPTSLFYETQLTAKKLIETATAAIPEAYLPMFLTEPKRYKSELMLAIEKNLFNYSAKPFEINKGLRIYEAEKKCDEVYDVAENILELTRDHGYRYKDIAVLSGSVSEYENIIPPVFSSYSIPYFIDKTKDVTSHPLVVFIISLVEMIVQNYSYESVFRLFKTRLTPMEPEDIDVFENFCLAKGIKGWKLTGDMDFYLKNCEPDFKEKITRLHAGFMEYTKEIRKVKNNKKISVLKLSEVIFETLYSLQIPEKLESREEISKAFKNTEKAYEDSQIWQSVTETFDTMASALGSQEMLPAEYLKILKAGFADNSLGIIPPGYDRIIFGDIERTRLPEIKALFIIGANDGILPRATELSGLFSDNDRASMEGFGLSLSKDTKRKTFEEMFLIYCGITQPSHVLSISYHKNDMQGKEKRPSFIVNRLKKLFPNIEIQRKSDKKGMDLISLPLPTIKNIQEEISKKTKKENISPYLGYALSYINKKSGYTKNIQMIKKGILYKNAEPPLSAKTVKSLYGNSLFSAVSRLESYAECPFGYYMKYGLKAKERPVYKLQTPDIGSFFHKLIENFSKYIDETNLSWQSLTKEDISLAVDKISGKTAEDFNNEIFLSSGSLSYLSKRLSEISKRVLCVLSNHIKNGSFVPMGYEVGFGKNNSLPPIVIELSNGQKMILTGKIDRVDILDSNGKKYVKIIDYKSGSKSFDLQNVYYGLQLQLMIYLDAFIQSGGTTEEFLPGGAFYFRIKNPIIQGASEFSDEEIERLISKELKMSGLMLKNRDVISGIDKSLIDENGNLSGASDIVSVDIKKDGELKPSSSVAEYESFIGLIDYAKQKAKNLGEDIYSGKIDIQPYKLGNKNPCIYCPFKSVCRFDPEYGGSYRYLRKIDKSEFLKSIVPPKE